MGNGGDVSIDTGNSEQGSSGSVSISSSSANHLSGSIALETGTGKQGSSGMISLETGFSDHSAGGINLRVGDTFGYRNGGDISLTAGLTSSSSMKGGTVRISAGEGSSDQLNDGGDGGDMIFTAGEAKGADSNDNGGSVTISGGNANQGYGGSLDISSGKSSYSASGDILVHTADAGQYTRAGSSGSLSLMTGSTHLQESGSVTITSGDSNHNNTGHVNIRSGDVLYGSGTAGNVSMSSGYSEQGSSGSFSIVTAQSGGSSRFARTGDIVMGTGDTPRGRTGSMLLKTGSTRNGESGSFELALGHSKGNYDGGSISMTAGDTFGKAHSGGDVHVFAGDGKSDGSYNSGGKGGDMIFTAGLGEGIGDNGDGGGIAISGGRSIHSNGGHIVLQSGSSEHLTSGAVVIDTSHAGNYGDSGPIRLRTGKSESSDSGSILITTGNAVDDKTLVPHTPTYKGGNSGSINITAGLAVDRGGNITMVAGGATGQIRRSRHDPTDQQGGDVLISSGGSIEASSGGITIGTANAGKKGTSGALTLSSGDSNEGDAGTIGILSGTSHEKGKGGDIDILAGASSSTAEIDGSRLSLHAGTSQGKKSTGGNTEIFGGIGYMGAGGRLDLTGGRAAGTNINTDIGGAVEILGGYSHYSSGGEINITSGRSERASSGDLALATPDSAKDGSSGVISITTGTSYKGDSGSIDMKTGNAHGSSGSRYDESHNSGNITMQVGGSGEDNGGSVWIAAGPSYSSRSSEGGSITLEAGDSRFDNGRNHLSGMIGGSVIVKAGASDGQSETDHAGSISLSAGNANSGIGGSASLLTGGSNEASSGSMMLGSSDAGEFGQSGSMSLFTGDVYLPRRMTRDADDSGAISISTGFSKHGFGGDISLTSGAGFGDYVNDDRGGGSISLRAGDTTGHSNPAGSVDIMSGWGHQTSGDVTIRTPKSSTSHAGNIVIETGASAARNLVEESGQLILSTGSSGNAGFISMEAGTSTIGDWDLEGGAINIKGGANKGAAGGHVNVSGGDSLTHNMHYSVGGNVNLKGGKSNGGIGGLVTISGGDSANESGGVQLETPSTSNEETSGSISISTGTSEHGTSGTIHLSTGSMKPKRSVPGTPGSIILESGSAGNEEAYHHHRAYRYYGFNTHSQVGGDLTLGSGNSFDGNGGMVDIKSGKGKFSGGETRIKGGEGLESNGGDFVLGGGSSSNGKGGDVTLAAGSSSSSENGSIVIGGSSGYKKGSVSIVGTHSNSDSGGDVHIASGSSGSSSSGSVYIESPYSGVQNEGVNIKNEGGKTDLSGQDVLLHSSNGQRVGKVNIFTGDPSSKTGYEEAGDIEVLTGKAGRFSQADSPASGKILIATSPNFAHSGRSGEIMISTGEVGLSSHDMRGSLGLSGGDIEALAHSGGSINLSSGSSSTSEAGDISIVSGSSLKNGGNINIIASASQYDKRPWMQHLYKEFFSKEINFGFDEYSPTFEERRIALQLKKTRDSTRLTSTVPVQVTTIQYSSDSRIKKNIKSANTDDLLDRMRQIELREYGYTEEWRQLRGLENDPRTRGVIAQELYEVFPEHIEILPELEMGKVNFENFHQVDKQGLVLDLIGALQAHTKRFQPFLESNQII